MPVCPTPGTLVKIVKHYLCLVPMALTLCGCNVHKSSPVAPTPEVSNDFIVERRDGADIGHDIAFDYDNPDHPLQLYWGDGSFPVYREYPSPSCQ